VISRKRNRGVSPPQDDSQRRLGRPTHLEQAARDPTQSRLWFDKGPASASQGPSIETPPIEELEMILDE
jgi:hypothetical protein